MKTIRLVAFACVFPIALSAQGASFVYRLGKDTLAIEQSARAGNRTTGEFVSRQGALVQRVAYDATFAADGKISAVTYRIMGADGKAFAGRPSEIRYAVKGDSVTRTVVWPDSTPARTFAVMNPIALIAPAYTMLEPAFSLMRKTNMPTATFTMLGGGVGATLPTIALTAGTADTIRQANGMIFIVGRDGALRAVDGSFTTGKILATRANSAVDVASVASRMTPTGTLSQRATARGSFQTQAPGAVIMVDYGRPLVRDRSVWGGLLVPVDSVWRLGANEATHFATGRDLDFGGITVPAGLYTLFLFNGKSGPQLAVNKQTGQWGTVYDPAKDLVRIPLTMAPTKEHVEEFTITVRQAAPSRGALEFAWGSQMATTNFVVK